MPANKRPKLTDNLGNQRMLGFAANSIQLDPARADFL